jgi:hypothetical protein
VTPPTPSPPLSEGGVRAAKTLPNPNFCLDAHPGISPPFVAGGVLAVKGHDEAGAERAKRRAERRAERRAVKGPKGPKGPRFSV